MKSYNYLIINIKTIIILVFSAYWGLIFWCLIGILQTIDKP